MSIITLETLTQKLSLLSSNENLRKQKIVEDKVLELIEYIDNIIDLDLDLNQYIYDSKNKNEIISDADFPNCFDNIDNNSLIIYIKKAQLYKIYNYSNLQDFLNDDITIYKKPEYGPFYEVVRDNHPQKLIIMVNDDIKEYQLLEIKNDIIEFIKKNPAFEKATTNDVKAFGVDGNTEFVLSSVRMDNLCEKDKIIERFIAFLIRRKKTELASKIQIRMPGSLIEGVRLYRMPDTKVSLDNIKYNTVDQLMTTPSSVVINNICIINNGIINTGTVNSNTVNNINSVAINNDKILKKTLTTFINNIKTSKPTWYLENTYIDFSIIEKAYRSYFDDNDIHTSIISRQLNNVLFTQSRRLQNVNKKLLKPLSEL